MFFDVTSDSAIRDLERVRLVLGQFDKSKHGMKQ